MNVAGRRCILWPVTEVDPWDPSNPRNRDRTRVSRRQIRDILMQWDPIGVAEVPEAADEYDCMIGPILRQLFESVTAPALAAWITSERVNHFGLTSREPR